MAEAQRLEQSTAEEGTGEAPAVGQTTLVLAAAVEVLILLGGLAWAIGPYTSPPLAVRITVAVALAVLGAAAFVLAAARAPRVNGQ